MSREAAAKFLIDCETDPKIEEALRGAQENAGNPFEAMAEIALKMGYEASAVELASAFAARAAADRAVISSQELSASEMDQVAGGGKLDMCSSDFDPESRCAFNDQCLNAWHYYKQRENCESTYRYLSDENCTFSDQCWGNILQYWQSPGQKPRW